MITFKRTIRTKPILQIGTLVKIKKNLKGGAYYGKDRLYFNHEMEKYREHVARITMVDNDGYYTLSIGRGWKWSNEMIDFCEI